MREFPEYYEYYGQAFKIVQTPEGGLRGYKLNTHTGRIEIANAALRKVLWARNSDDIYGSDAEEFVRITEFDRARQLHGDGPIFALYKVVKDMSALSKTVDRQTWTVLAAAIREIRHRTFQLWEEEFARRDAGEPPTFQYEDRAGPDVKTYGQPDPTPDLPPGRWR